MVLNRVLLVLALSPVAAFGQNSDLLQDLREMWSEGEHEAVILELVRVKPAFQWDPSLLAFLSEIHEKSSGEDAKRNILAAFTACTGVPHPYRDTLISMGKDAAQKNKIEFLLDIMEQEQQKPTTPEARLEVIKHLARLFNRTFGYSPYQETELRQKAVARWKEFWTKYGDKIKLDETTGIYEPLENGKRILPPEDYTGVIVETYVSSSLEIRARAGMTVVLICARPWAEAGVEGQAIELARTDRSSKEENNMLTAVVVRAVREGTGEVFFSSNVEKTKAAVIVVEKTAGPKLYAQWIDDLEDPERRNDALTALMAAGRLAVPHLVDALNRPKPLNEKKIEEVMSNLGASKLKIRDASEEMLMAMGRDVLPWIGRAAESKNPEIRMRARRIKEKLEEDAIPGPVADALIRIMKKELEKDTSDAMRVVDNGLTVIDPVYSGNIPMLVRVVQSQVQPWTLEARQELHRIRQLSHVGRKALMVLRALPGKESEDAAYRFVLRVAQSTGQAEVNMIGMSRVSEILKYCKPEVLGRLLETKDLPNNLDQFIISALAATTDGSRYFLDCLRRHDLSPNARRTAIYSLPGFVQRLAPRDKRKAVLLLEEMSKSETDAELQQVLDLVLRQLKR